MSGRLNVKVSNDTLLRMVRRRGVPDFQAPSIVGIDDWAWKRNHRYGTLLCDLERRRTIALLPDREPATAEAWLARQPQISIAARDRGGGYAIAVQRALPHAIQVADRWHLMENASHAFRDAVRKCMRQIRTTIGAAKVDPALLTFAEKLQYEAICAARKPMPPSWRFLNKRSRSKRSCAAPVTAEVSSAKSCAVSAQISSAPDAVLWSPTSPGSIRSGLRAVEMAPRCGARSDSRDFGAVWAL